MATPTALPIPSAPQGEELADLRSIPPSPSENSSCFPHKTGCHIGAHRPKKRSLGFLCTRAALHRPRRGSNLSIRLSFFLNSPMRPRQLRTTSVQLQAFGPPVSHFTPGAMNATALFTMTIRGWDSVEELTTDAPPVNCGQARRLEALRLGWNKVLQLSK